jgi:hypothetical protein
MKLFSVSNNYSGSFLNTETTNRIAVETGKLSSVKLKIIRNYFRKTTAEWILSFAHLIGK